MWKSTVITALILIGTLASDAAIAESSVSTDHLAASPNDQLDEAVRLYQTGKHEDAKVLLTRLVNDPSMVNESLRQRARVYLGEVLYLKGDKEEARRLFETILMQDPSYVIDPFAHPPDVCGFFETIRAYIRPVPSSAAPAPKPLGRPPMSAYAGFGVYQLQNGRSALGATLATTQAALGALSLASFYGLSSDPTWETDDQRTALNRRRTLQWGATAGFYAVWMWGVIDAHRHWRSTRGQMVSFHGSVAPTYDLRGASLNMTIPIR